MNKSRLLLIFIAFVLVLNSFAANLDGQSNGQWQKGKEAYDKGVFDDALEYFKNAVESDPQNGNFLNWLGAAYFQNRMYQEAIDVCKRSLNLPSSKGLESMSWKVIAGSQAELGQMDSAILSEKKVIELLPNQSGEFEQLSRFYIGNKQYDEAITAAKMAIELQADSYFGNLYLGFAYGEKRQYDEASKVFERAIGINPQATLAYNHLGRVSLSNDNPSKALWAARKLIEIQPSNWGYNSMLSMAYYYLGDYDQGKAAANKALELLTSTGNKIDNESLTSCLAARSLLYRRTGNQAESLQDAEKAYSLDPTMDLTKFSLGAAYIDHGRYDEAIKLLTPTETPTILGAIAYAKQGKMKEAINIYSSIPGKKLSSRLGPEMDDRTTLMQLFKPSVKMHRDQAISFEAKKQYKDALSELSEALTMADETESQAIQEALFNIVRRNPTLSSLPEEARNHVLRAEMLIKEASFEKATEEYRKAIQIAPYVGQLYFNSALIHAELKDFSKAIRQMKIYLKAAPDAPDAQAAKDGIVKWEFAMEREKSLNHAGSSL